MTVDDAIQYAERAKLRAGMMTVKTLTETLFGLDRVFLPPALHAMRYDKGNVLRMNTQTMTRSTSSLFMAFRSQSPTDAAVFTVPFVIRGMRILFSEKAFFEIGMSNFVIGTGMTYPSVRWSSDVYVSGNEHRGLSPAPLSAYQDLLALIFCFSKNGPLHRPDRWGLTAEGIGYPSQRSKLKRGE